MNANAPLRLVTVAPVPERRYTLRRKLRRHLPDKPQVWLARDKRLGCEVVLKRYSSNLRARYESDLQFLNAYLPQTPRLLDAYHDEQSSMDCLVREFIPGELIEELESIAPVDALQIGAQIAWLLHGLHAAKPHSAALGSLSPADLLRSPDGQIRLIAASPAHFGHIGGGAIRDDVRAAARLTMRMLAGNEICSEDDLLRALPEEIASALRRALEPDSDKRHATAQWLAQALDEARAKAAESPELSSRGWLPAPAIPLAPVPVLRPVCLEESLVAHALRTSAYAAGNLAMARLANKAYDLTQQSTPFTLRALDTLDIDRHQHQIDAALQVVNRAEMGAGAILADEVGLGKTIEALMVFQELRARGQAGSALIVASPSGAAQWLAETRSRIRRGGHERGFRLYKSAKDAAYPLLIVSSATIKQERHIRPLLELRRDDLVVVDEAHQCCSSGKNRLSPLGRSIARLYRKRLLLLSATPLGGRIADLYTLADLIQPGLLGTTRAEADRPEQMRSLRARLQALMIRHRRSDLREIVTPKIECRTIAVPQSSEAAKIQAAAELICGDWADERVVVFARSITSRQALAREIARRAPERIALVFHSNRRDSREQERSFNDYADAVIVSGDVVSEGMNWQRARCLLHLDPPLTPLIWEQRVGRIFRLGQRAGMLEIVHLVGEGGPAERLLALYAGDLGLFSLPIGEAASTLDHLPNTRLRNLEPPARAILRGRLTEERIAVLGKALRLARDSYDRQMRESALLDDIYFGGSGA